MCSAFKIHLYQYDDNKTDAEWSLELDAPLPRAAAKALRHAIEESLRNEPKRISSVDSRAAIALIGSASRVA